LLDIVLDLDLKVIGFYVDNAVSVSYFYTVNCIESIGFPLFVPLEVVVIYYFWGDKIPLCPTINKYVALVGSKLYPDF